MLTTTLPDPKAGGDSAGWRNQREKGLSSDSATPHGSVPADVTVLDPDELPPQSGGQRTSQPADCSQALTGLSQVPASGELVEESCFVSNGS